MQTLDRAKFLGGSDIAGVMGLSRWVTPLKLWAEKTGRIKDEVDSEAAEIGTELEDYVAKKFQKKTGKAVRRDTRTFTHPDLPFLVAHIDRWVVGGELLECKTCSAWKAKEWEGEEIPVEYVLQVNFYLGILKMETGYIATLIGGQKFIWKELKFDRELFGRQVAAATHFWENFVVADQPPEAMAADNESTLLALYPSANETILEIEDEEKQSDIDTALEHRLEIMKEIDNAKLEKEAIDAKLKEVIKENSGIQTAKYKVTWKEVSRPFADTEKMKEAGIFDQYSKITTTRQIRVNARKG